MIIETPEVGLGLWDELVGDFTEDGGPRGPDSERIRRLAGAIRDGLEMPFDIAPDGTIIWKLWGAALFQTKPTAPCYTLESLVIHNEEAAYEALAHTATDGHREDLVNAVIWNEAADAPSDDAWLNEHVLQHGKYWYVGQAPDEVLQAALKLPRTGKSEAEWQVMREKEAASITHLRRRAEAGDARAIEMCARLDATDAG